MGNVSHRSADLVPDCATKTATSDHSALPLGSFRWKLWVFWQIVGDVEPGRFVCDEDMKSRFTEILMNREHRGCDNQRNSVKAPKESTH